MPGTGIFFAWHGLCRTRGAADATDGGVLLVAIAVGWRELIRSVLCHAVGQTFLGLAWSTSRGSDIEVLMLFEDI